MIFSSYEFLFLFLPIVWGVFAMLTRTGSHRLILAWLTLASLFFYGWWNPWYLPVLVASILGNFLFGRAMMRWPGHRKALLITGVTLNLALLGYFKYTHFFLDTFNDFAGTDFSIGRIILPLAISFHTFQQIAYLVDLYRGKEQEDHDLLQYLLFVSFFPQLIAGPIVKHRELVTQFARDAFSRIDLRNVAMGITAIAIGFFKKSVAADSIAQYANAVFDAGAAGQTLGFYEAWGGALSYTMQLYFDFSGYIDMATGAALLFNIRLPLNFYSPYKSLSIIDFWRRWHITLSRFLRDFLYIPLGGNRKGSARKYANLLLTMLIGGLWHGAGWTFVFWGGLHGMYLILNHGWRALRGERASSTRFTRFLSWLLTFLAIVLGWVFFRAESFPAALTVLQGMISFETISPWPYIQEFLWWWAPDIAGIRFPEWIYGTALLALLSLIVFFAPNTHQILSLEHPETEPVPAGDRTPKWLHLHWKPTAIFAVLTGMLTIISLIFLTLYQEHEFLYFQF
ncbi:MBOAT family protein [Candidatus Peregrinibacteria bacterium]|nr:MBOAT family protein [Candidatus Peregrinibacteria bacterium]